jgi:hypothetical protein
MKTNSLIKAILLYILISLVGIINAQTLTIKGKVLLNDKATLETFKISIVDLDTIDTHNTKTIKINGNFNYKLNYNKNYLIVFQKEGFQSKAVAIDTHCKTNKDFIYKFFVNLIDTEPIILDAQFAGGIYYNKKNEQFSYYLRN